LRSNAEAAFPDRLVVNDVGLGDREGEITIYFSEESTTATNILGRCSRFRRPSTAFGR
jgi:hypothetical protein